MALDIHREAALSRDYDCPRCRAGQGNQKRDFAERAPVLAALNLIQIGKLRRACRDCFECKALMYLSLFCRGCLTRTRSNFQDVSLDLEAATCIEA